MDDRYVYLALPKDLYERWNRQINTPYLELSEQEKESDRKEVRQYLPLIESILTAKKEELKKKIEAEPYPNTTEAGMYRESILKIIRT